MGTKSQHTEMRSSFHDFAKPTFIFGRLRVHGDTTQQRRTAIDARREALRNTFALYVLKYSSRNTWLMAEG
jgi:hypothetical protein